MNEPLLLFRGIEKTYAETNILRNVDISLFPGKCILLSGNNGSGKTTLLKIIAGLEAPSRAEIELSGKSHSWKSACLLYTSPSPRDYAASRMPSSA